MSVDAGQIIGGSFSKIAIREKKGEKLELGSLLMIEEENEKMLFQVYDLSFGSQIPQGIIELASGFDLEGYGDSINFIDSDIRNYTIAEAKSLLRIINNEAKTPKTLPSLFSKIKFATNEDFNFLTKPKNPMYLGKIRSGSKILDVDVSLDATNFFTHHVLIPATTGRGKSNFVKVMLWNALDYGKTGILVLDPHDEYYGRQAVGLKDHKNKKENLVYYSPFEVPSGEKQLIINMELVKPDHLNGLSNFTETQDQVMSIFYGEYKEKWLEKIMMSATPEGTENIKKSTYNSLHRKLRYLLGITIRENKIKFENAVFSTDGRGLATLGEIVKGLSDGQIIIIDTSSLPNQLELVIGSIIATECFQNYKEARRGGIYKEIPLSVVIEEAPRVLKIDSVEEKENIYSQIAREGRKFKIGLVAITQLTSVIPKSILTNINTKIILGNEMATERNAIIESAAKDLSDDHKTIASLDIGEAIVSSTFAKFAIPIQIPKFEDVVEKSKETKPKKKKKISGI